MYHIEKERQCSYNRSSVGGLRMENNKFKGGNAAEMTQKNGRKRLKRYQGQANMNGQNFS